MPEYFTRRPPPKPLDYEEEYWGVIVDPDGNVRDRLQEREQHLQDINQELEFLNSLPPGRILDVGCGLGYLLSGLTLGWERHGVEMSRFAAQRAQQWGVIHVGCLEEAAYPSEWFDVVVMHHVIEHMEDPVGAIIEVRRIMKRGGVLVLGTPDFDSGCARRFGKNYRLLHDPTHISLFTNDSMQQFLRDHGFVIDRVEYPFFETRHFTPENLLRLFDASKTSPPFYGNFMTFYCRKPDRGEAYESIMALSRLASRVAETLEAEIQRAGQAVAECLNSGGKILTWGDGKGADAALDFTRELIKSIGEQNGAGRVLSLVSESYTMPGAGNEGNPLHHLIRQVQTQGSKGDALIAISPEASSSSLVEALAAARRQGLRVIALLGDTRNPGLEGCEACIHIPARNPQLVQEMHLAALHTICQQVQRQ